MKRHLLMDLGASRTRIVQVGQAGLRSAASAIMTTTAGPLRLLAVGDEAAAAVEREPDNIRARRPQSEGRVADPSIVEAQLAFWRQQSFGPSFWPASRSHLTLTVPCGAADYERSALTDVGHAAHFTSVTLVDELVAHAAGLDDRIPSDEPVVVVVVGAAYAQAGVVRKNEVLVSRMIHEKNPRDGAAGEAVTAELRHWIGKTFGLSVGVDQVERLKCGEARKLVGYSSSEGTFKAVEISNEQVLQAVRPVLTRLAGMVTDVVEAGAETVGESVRESVRRQGVFLTGGGAKLKGLESFLRETTQMPVVLAAAPEDTAIRGLERLEARQ